MNRDRAILLAAFSVLAVPASIADAQVSSTSLRIPPVPSKSLPPAGRLVRSFSARGIQAVVLRAADVERAEVKTVPGGQFIAVSGIPEGGAKGYHSTDPNWREIPASSWGLDFKARSFGPTLVVSTENEIRYIHHDYHMGSVAITVPEGVKVIKENRKLTGEGPADLSAPASR